MDRDRIIISSEEEMVAYGKKLGSQMTPGTILALSGDLGAGKTTFVQGLAQGLGIFDPIQSPTFVYMNAYIGKFPLFHFDLYRLKGKDDFIGLGFDEYFMPTNICVIEWPERIDSLLPEHTQYITFSYLGKSREVIIS